MFSVGQKVICIKAPPGAPFFPWRAFPKHGQVYTIRDFRSDDSLRLVEIQNDIGMSGLECGFCPRRFRPVVERKTDISIFQALLVPGAKIRETA